MTKIDYDRIFDVMQIIGRYIDDGCQSDDMSYEKFLQDIWYMLDDILHGGE